MTLVPHLLFSVPSFLATLFLRQDGDAKCSEHFLRPSPFRPSPIVLALRRDKSIDGRNSERDQDGKVGIEEEQKSGKHRREPNRWTKTRDDPDLFFR